MFEGRNLWMVEEKIQKCFAGDGITIYHLPFQRFKTNSITLCFIQPLKTETAAKMALLPAVLRQGSFRYPTATQLSDALKELYGAVLECDTSKKGEKQIVHFYVETVKDALLGEEGIFEKGLALLIEVLKNPRIEEGIFSETIVLREKALLKKQIQAKINDKGSYILERCIEEMCQAEDYSISDMGTLEDVDQITAQNLYEFYTEFLTKTPIEVYVTGDVEAAFLEKLKQQIFALGGERRKLDTTLSFGQAPLQTKYIEEKMNITQGKLCMGYRTNVHPCAKEYTALLLYNSILGGGLHSKLFQNVREKEGLAYYAYSRLDRFKGLMFISTGIEMSNKQKVIDIVRKQLQEMKEGNITEHELTLSKQSIINGLYSMKDHQLSVLDYTFSNNLMGKQQTLDQLAQEVQQVDKNAVVRIAEQIKEDTIAFLTGIEGGQSGER